MSVSTSSAPVYVSPLSLDYVGAESKEQEVRINIAPKNEKDKKTQSSTTGSALLKLPSGRSFKVDFAKMKPAEKKKYIQGLLTTAENATLEDKEKVLGDCDQALTVIAKDFFKNSEVQDWIRVLRLELPKFKASLLSQDIKSTITLNGVETDLLSRGKKNILEILEDHGTSFAAFLEGRLSEQMVQNLRGKYSDSSSEEAKLFNQLLDACKNEDMENAENAFFTLMRLSVNGSLSEEVQNDFIHLVMSSKLLHQFLQTGGDRVVLEVRGQRIPCSALLLSYHSGYFQAILQTSAGMENEISLIGTNFDGDTISLFLHWIHNPFLTDFRQHIDPNLDPKKRVEKFEMLLYHVASLALRNEAEFLEKIQLELAHLLDDDTLVDLFRLALNPHTKLKLAEAFCIDYINAHPSQAVKIRVENGNYSLIQQRGRDIPKVIIQVLDLLKSKIKTADIVSTEEPPKGCRRAFYKLANCTSSLSSKLWNGVPNVFKRAGAIWLSIFSIQKVAHQAIWPAWKMSAVSVSLAVTYPCIFQCFKSCVARPLLQRWQISALPQIVPLGIQRSFVRSLDKIGRCFACRTHTRHRHELVDSLPEQLSRLDLSFAEGLTDDVFIQLAAKHKNVEELVLGFPCYLTERGIAALSSWSKLKTLNIRLFPGHSPGLLNTANFARIFGQGKGICFKIEIPDEIAAYYPLNFLGTFPEDGEVQITIQHIVMQQSLFILDPGFERRNRMQWPDFMSNVMISCNRITHFHTTTGIKFTGEDLLTLGRLHPELKSLRLLVNCHFLTDEVFLTIIMPLQNLEELLLGNAFQLGNESVKVLIENCPRLTRLTLLDSRNITSEGLSHVAEADNLQYCALVGIEWITDSGVQLLLSRQKKIELHVIACKNLSPSLKRSLLEKVPSTDEYTPINIAALPVPHLLGGKSFPPILFKFIIDNLGFVPDLQTMGQDIARLYMNVEPIQLFAAVQKELGLVPENQITLHTSQIKALALFPWKEFYTRFKAVESEYRQKIDTALSDGDLIKYYYYKYNHHINFLKKTIFKWSPYLESVYQKYLSETFSVEFANEVNSLVNSFLEQLKTKHKEKENAEKWNLFLLRVFDATNSIGEIFIEFFSGIFIENEEPAKIFIEEIKKKNWSNQQRAAALLAAIFSDWSWLGSLIFKPSELAELNPDVSLEDSSQTGVTIEFEEKERKER